MENYETYRIIMIHFLINHINTLCSNIKQIDVNIDVIPIGKTTTDCFCNYRGHSVEGFPKSDQRKKYPSQMYSAACFVPSR